MHKNIHGSWRLSFIYKLAAEDDFLSYVNILPTGNISSQTTTSASKFLLQKDLHFVNIYDPMKQLNQIELDYPVCTVASGGYLEVRTSPSRLAFYRDTEHCFMPTRLQKRHRSSQGRSQGHKKVRPKSGSSNTGNPPKIITIYGKQNRNKSTGIDSVRQVNNNDVVLPMPCEEPPHKGQRKGRPHQELIKGVLNLRKRRHFVVPSTMIPTELNNKTVSDIVSTLQEAGKFQSFMLMDISTQKPVRFSLVGDEEFEKLTLESTDPKQCFKAGANDYIWRYDTRSSLEIEGTLVSWWSEEKQLHQFSRSHLEQVQCAVHKGFGPRLCAFNIGVNVYFGSRCSDRPKRNPFILSKENISSQDFQRQGWSTGMLLFSRIEIEKAGLQIQQVATRLNPFYNTFTGDNVCNKRNIYTAGVIPTIEGAGTVRPLGFANFPHKDLGDYIHSQAIEYFKERFLLEKLNGKKYKQKDRERATFKLAEVKDHTGALGVPTTCGHQTFKGNDSKKLPNLHATFGMFDFSMPIANNTVHHFYGWAFRHCTLVPFWPKKGGIIQYCNSVDEEDEIVVLAWGRAGGTKETRDQVPLLYPPKGIVIQVVGKSI